MTVQRAGTMVDWLGSEKVHRMAELTAVAKALMTAAWMEPQRAAWSAACSAVY
jgi:hypothetical protein